MKMHTKIMAMITLILSTIMVISSENWLSMWMGLEINMMSFIPLMEKMKNKKSSEAKMMYFLIQSISSMTFLFMIIINSKIMINENLEKLSTIMMNMSMIMKMGMAPMNLWFINIMNKMSWNNCLMLMTWQKIAPMFVMSNMYMPKMMIMIITMMNAIIGAIGGLNQTSIMKIMAFSSVNHMSWMFICMKYSNEMWIKYLIIYTMMLTPMILFFKMNSIHHINQMNMNIKTKTQKINIIIMMMSMGGLPPFIGFYPKWMVIQSIMMNENMITMLILMFSSMITLFYYMRIISPTIMMNSTNQKWIMKTNESKEIMMMNMITNLMLPLTLILNFM
uniref:NADH-ubiquinone oxidoreductase chain 2 n=1 Tax=Halovelia lannae TaxID=3095931 RepID=A0AB38Z7E1_9HEMI|nr:NADH dehydrogenase subunit 2 [Halovelia lannae]WPW47191.1 NADH dehydrogenase subunit 2 [Halovelia lannae]